MPLKCSFLVFAQCETGKSSCEPIMIKLLAEFFRAFHYIVGISLPPPGTSDRSFVLWWLGGIAIVFAFCGMMFHIIPSLVFRH